jgi:hypothetical protein
LADHLRRHSSPPPAYDGHSSSADEDSHGHSNTDCGEESTNSDDERKDKSSDETLSDAMGRSKSRRNWGRSRQGSEYAASDSEATEWESDFKMKKAKRGEEAQSGGAATERRPGTTAAAAGRAGNWGDCQNGTACANSHFPCGLHGAGVGPRPGGSDTSDSWYIPPARNTRKRGTRGKGKGSRAAPVKRKSKKKVKKDDPLLARFGPHTWKQNIFSYKNSPLEFTGPEPGCTHPYGRVPSLLGLFDKFWSPKLQRRIVRETNFYASEVIDEKGWKTRGGLDWTPLCLEEFRAYLGICLYMGIKKLPSTRLYWSRDEPLLHCHVISQLMTRDRYENITSCLHVASAPPSVTDKDSPTYDKLHKIRWMLDEIRDRFKSMWSPNQQMTVDEGMIMYKGKYCPVRQYMPKKPIRFGIKVWAAADALSKYLWNFEVYCGKEGNPHDDDDVHSESGSGHQGSSEDDIPCSGKDEGLQGRNVVKHLMQDLQGRGHIVTTDNFFTSVPLFIDLLDTGIMATGTLRGNCKYVPRNMFAYNITKKKDIGWIDYRMHEEGNICCAVWKDKQAVRLLSTHAEPISRPGCKHFVYRKIGGKRKKVRTGPMHLQYTKNMRGVDAADQLRGTYSCITRSHKWWHRLFSYLLDTIVCNMWIIHSDLKFRFLDNPLTHLSFQLQLANDLSTKWAGRKRG